MFIKPAPGLTIVDPDQQDFLPAEGRDVSETDYWHRMWLAGDVTKETAKTDPLQASAQAGTVKSSKAAT